MNQKKLIKKTYKIALIALVLALSMFSFSGSTTTTGTQWIVNNTNLAPDAGAPHPFGTGERVSGVTYWTNNSPIELFVFSHASNVSDTAEIHLSINGTVVSDTSGRPIGGAESSNKTLIATIPQYANYSVEFLNFHHYEWREYPILTGNVSTSISTTGTGSCVDCINSTQLSDNMSLKVNKSGDTWLGNMIMDGHSIRAGSNFIYIDSATPVVRIEVDSIHHSYYEQFDDSFNFSILNGSNIFYTLGLNGLDMQNKNITNCANCWNETINNTKVNKSGDTMTGDLNFSNANITNTNNLVEQVINYTWTTNKSTIWIDLSSYDTSSFDVDSIIYTNKTFPTICYGAWLYNNVTSASGEYNREVMYGLGALVGGVNDNTPTQTSDFSSNITTNKQYAFSSFKIRDLGVGVKSQYMLYHASSSAGDGITVFANQGGTWRNTTRINNLTLTTTGYSNNDCFNSGFIKISINP